MQDESPLPPLKIARRVNRRHGEIFAAEWFPSSYGGEDVWDAFAATGLIEWPDDDPNRPLGQIVQDPRQARYQDLEDEILKRVFASVCPAVADEFVKVAREVLSREAAAVNLKIAQRVTRKHGERFAQKWRAMQTGDVWSEAFAKAGVIEWPGGEEPTPEQERFDAVRNEILNRAFDAAMPAVAEAFVKAARAILARERKC